MYHLSAVTEGEKPEEVAKWDVNIVGDETFPQDDYKELLCLTVVRRQFHFLFAWCRSPRQVDVRGHLYDKTYHDPWRHQLGQTSRRIRWYFLL